MRQVGRKRSDKIRKRGARKARQQIKKRRKEELPAGRPLIAVRNPLFDLTREQAEKIVHHHQEAAKEARPKLVELLRLGDWRVMLAQLSLYRLTLAIKDGVPVELDDEPIQPAVEYIQALALVYSDSSEPIRPTPFAVAAEALDHAKAILLAETLPKKAPEPGEDWIRTTALASVRSHAVMVRGPGYPHQIDRITKRIAERTGNTGQFEPSLVLQLMDAAEHRINTSIQ